MAQTDVFFLCLFGHGRAKVWNLEDSIFQKDETARSHMELSGFQSLRSVSGTPTTSMDGTANLCNSARSRPTTP